ncbi:hypothetical protein BRM1_07600 [Brevibacterium sp. BRM-1]|uniref:Rv3654c family TadE-like protein n=1 Tax=Brevibacterium sp. BRM-1 TaxID=2999062 RepID=UPI0022823A8E|nr:Rv3654c family TadE-like protein [Brevibacterium sp. BRM-1]WAL39165.1 hypothetical protein BRM1_07600 [Brevibacterium sp. BRM-1]
MGVGLMVGALVLVLGVGVAGRAFFVHARADGTADLAALAAADAVRATAPGEPCEVAADLVKRRGLALRECIARADLGTVKVVVEAKPPAPLPALRATAVAGGPEPAP